MLSFCVFSFAPNKQIDFEKYAVFQKINNIPSPHTLGFYAGDYWYVWPSVQWDLMRGYTSYGLTYRGDGNPKARQAVEEQQNRQGYIEVYCINNEDKDCLTWIRVALVARQITLLDTTRKSELVNILKLKVE